MKKRICALIAVVLMFASVGQVLAKDGRYVREEAARRDMKLLTIEQAKDIAAKRLGSANVRFKDFDLDNEADDYPNGSDFRPVRFRDRRCNRRGLEVQARRLDYKGEKFLWLHRTIR